MRWQSEWVSYIALKCHERWSTRSFKLDVHLCPPSANFAFFTLLPSQTDTSKRNSVRLCQTIDSKSRYNNLPDRSWGRPLPEKIGAKNLLHLFGFSTTLWLNGKYLLNEALHRQLDKGVGKCKWSIHCLKSSWTLLHSSLKPDWSFYPPSLFCPVPVHRIPS